MSRRRGFSLARSRAKAVLAVLALPAALAGRAAAQQAPGSVEFGLGAGRFLGGTFSRGSLELFDEKVLADQDILKGFWLGAQVSREWAVEVAVRRTETHIVQPGDGVGPYRPALAVFIPSSVELSGARTFRLGNFAPYVGFGAGLVNLEIDTEDPAVRDVNRFCLSVSAGARFYATRAVGARIDLRGRATYLGARRLGADGGWTDAGRWLADAEILGGVFVTFGGKP